MTEPSANLEFGPESESWKHEVASRLDHYRAKNNRKLSGDFSMRFNFEGDPAGPRQQLCVPVTEEAENSVEELATEKNSEVVSEKELSQPAGDASELKVGAVAEPVEAAPPLVERPTLRPSVPFKRKIMMAANVIEFPRLFPPEPPSAYALGEPLLPTTPRILDAPEIAQPLLETPILDGMRLDPIASQVAEAFELPLQAATVPRRVCAALADGVVVLLGSGIFGAITEKMLPAIEWTVPTIAAAMIVPVLLWVVYQVLFILYAARTPGMALSRLAFSTFNGTAPNRRERRLRLIGMAVSCSSLMLGFFWAFFDEDTLCWHDRISRTYTFQQKV